jgi:hypothetical protein
MNTRPTFVQSQSLNDLVVLHFALLYNAAMGIFSRTPLQEFSSLPFGYYRVQLLLGDSEEEYFDVFQHTQDGWAVFNQSYEGDPGEWVAQSEKAFAKDVYLRQGETTPVGIRGIPQPLSEQEAQLMIQSMLS